MHNLSSIAHQAKWHYSSRWPADQYVSANWNGRKIDYDSDIQNVTHSVAGFRVVNISTSKKGEYNSWTHNLTTKKSWDYRKPQKMFFFMFWRCLYYSNFTTCVFLAWSCISDASNNIMQCFANVIALNLVVCSTFIYK